MNSLLTGMIAENERAQRRLDGSSTAFQVLHGRDLTGKVAVITGANTGIGYETARALAFHGCTVIFACRDLDKAQAAIAKILLQHPQAKCSAFKLDLCSLYSVKSFATTFKSQHSKVDMLILNAGVFGLPFSTTTDSYETTFQVNHLSQFYLTLLLESILSAGSRVVVVSSECHRVTTIRASTISQSTLSPNSGDWFWSLMAYNNSKLCNVLFTTELAKRWENKNICVSSVNPGNMVSSDISRNWWFYKLLFAFMYPFTKSVEQAAATSVYCATSVDLENISGLYFNNCCQSKPSAISQDLELSKALWEISKQMIENAIGKNAFPSETK